MNKQYPFFVSLLVFTIISGCTSKILTNNEIKMETERLKELNSENINPNNYPQDFGTDERNNQKIIRQYHCNDICPNYGHVILEYENIESAEMCEKIGGETTMYGIPDQDNFKACVPVIN